jgi:hypothetical protein
LGQNGAIYTHFLHSLPQAETNLGFIWGQNGAIYIYTHFWNLIFFQKTKKNKTIDCFSNTLLFENFLEMKNITLTHCQHQKFSYLGDVCVKQVGAKWFQMPLGDEISKKIKICFFFVRSISQVILSS